MMKELLTISSIVLLAYACNNTQAPALPEKVTFAEHVAPILYKNCMPCHRKGGPAPIVLVSYKDAAKRAKMLSFVTESRFMPPWPADATYSHFIDERVLSHYEIAVLKKWAEQGAPQGDSSKTPVPPVFFENSIFGKPDLVLKAKTPYQVKGSNKDYFTIAKIPFELPKDTFIRVVEFVPGNNKVVHHMNGYLINYAPTKKANVYDGDDVVDYEEHNNIEAFKKLKVLNDDNSYPPLTPSLCNYLPGVIPNMYPDEIGGYKMSRKGAILFNMHYGPQPIDIGDSSYFNIFFRKSMPKRPIRELMLGTNGVAPVVPPLVIQPNTVSTFRTQYTVSDDISIITVNPHMHLLGKSFWAYALTSKGDTIRLIKIPKWDFRWQYFYTYPNLLKIPAGSTIYVEGVYDNTSANPNNPYNPPRVVSERNGSMRTTDEMFQFIINYVPYKSGDENISLNNTTLH